MTGALPEWLMAAFWGLVGGSALLIGAAGGWAFKLPQRAIAGIMAAGSGVLISAVAFELMDEAFEQGGIGSTAAGFVGGAVVYTALNILLTRRGAQHRKRSGHMPHSRQPSGEGGAAIALGALLDGVPESIVIGASLIGGHGVSAATVAAVFLSNVPEGLSSAAGMKRAGRPAAYVFGVWGAIALASGVAALAGNLLLAGAPGALVAAVTATAAGAILAMLVDTMIPEAFETAHDYAGLIAVVGFLVAFALTKLG